MQESPARQTHQFFVPTRHVLHPASQHDIAHSPAAAPCPPTDPPAVLRDPPRPAPARPALETRPPGLSDRHTMRTLRFARRTALPLLATLALACGPKDDSGVADNASAERAYLGLDGAIDRAIDLGFAGFNAANSANIPEQTDVGDLGGVMTIGGQVDQGSSDHKNMRLTMMLTEDYADVVFEGDIAIVYNGGPADLDMEFKGLPDADLTGSLVGTFTMTGDLMGDVTLDLTFTGTTMDAGDGTIVRVPGSVHVVGSATSDYGVFMVDVSV